MVGVKSVEIGAKSRQRQAVRASPAKVCQRGTEGGETERYREREKYIDAAKRIRPDILRNGEDRTGGYVLRRVEPETRTGITSTGWW